MMFSSSRSPLRRAGPAPVIARFNALAKLNANEANVLARLDDWRWDPPGSELVRDRTAWLPRVLVSGWAARVRWLDDGRRQIIGLILPGDGIGLCRRPQPLDLCPLLALTPVQTLDASPIMRAVQDETDYARLSHAVNIAAALDEAWLMEQVVRLGRLTAYERVAHLILEVRARLRVLGPEVDGKIPFPLTQEILADVTGLSLMHVNRTLQQLRREKLIELGQGRLKIIDVQALMDLSGFREPRPDAWIFEKSCWI
ncbi:MAG TPA: Crp/Fnr family transcriptional regulator [Brevundimonas sp.]|jgi:CRP-like cAMP-binding protein